MAARASPPPDEKKRKATDCQPGAEHPDFQVWRSAFGAGLVKTPGPQSAAERKAAAWRHRQQLLAARAAASARERHGRISEAEARRRMPKAWVITATQSQIPEK
jgi:hypothetical protein